VLRPASSFGDLCELWLADLDVQDINEGTKQNYRDDLRRYVRPVFEHYQLGEITTGRVQWFLRAEATVSYSRARHSRTMLNLLFKFALRHDALPRNPVEGTSPLARPHRTIAAMTLEQVQAIRAAAATWRTGPDVLGPKPDGKVRDICEILLGTSMRPGEVLALRPRDVTETRRGMFVHVQGTVVRRKGVADFRQEHPKTDASRRRIAVPPFAAQVIRRRMADLGPDQDDVTLFHNRYGRVLTLNNTRRTFREFLAGAGLADSWITLRWYRRTGATVLARGLGLDVAAAFLGHTSNAITEGHYVAPDQTVDMAPATVLDRTLRSVDPDGTLLALGGSDDEDDLLDEIDTPDDDTAA
jgi:integrase